jgi:hypothetical protein
MPGNGMGWHLILRIKRLQYCTVVEEVLRKPLKI